MRRDSRNQWENRMREQHIAKIICDKMQIRVQHVQTDTELRLYLL